VTLLATPPNTSFFSTMFSILLIMSTVTLQASAALQCNMAGTGPNEFPEYFDVGKQRPYRLDQSVKVQCLQSKCANGKPYTYCKFSKEDFVYGNDRLTFTTRYYVPSDGTGVCGYVVNMLYDANKDSTDAHIKEFCARQ
jgi:hypothetical protein